MLTISVQKLKKQKWLSFCLILGMALLVAVFVCQPMFRSGSLDKLLKLTFDDHIKEYNEFPVAMFHSGEYKMGDGVAIENVNAGLTKNRSIWGKYLTEFDELGTFTTFRIKDMSGLGTYQDKNMFLEAVYMPDVEDHIEIITGTDGSEYDGKVMPCLISEYVMDTRGLIVGEEIEFDRYYTESDETLKLVVAGVFKIKDAEDPFWYFSPYKDDRAIYVSSECMDKICNEYGGRVIEASTYMILDEDSINSRNIDYLIECVDSFKAGDKSFGISFDNVLNMYVSKRQSINVMLWVLEIPVLVMLIVFIYMVSGQMADSLEAEIAMQRSRGFSKRQVVLLYTVMALIISAFGLLIGIPMGYILCKLSASTTDFLKFSAVDVSMYKPVSSMLVYGAIASLTGIIITVIPIFGRLKLSIVEQKSDYKFAKRMLWEKYFVDVILLAVSLYLLHNYSGSIEKLREQALVGGKMDPMIFINTCIFMVAAGLVVFRLIHYLVLLIYRLGRSKWKPVSYVSFLQITRSFNRQCFISVFMILTVSMGLFDANVARTINRNKEDRIIYSNGAYVIMSEKWSFYEYKDARREGAINRRYFEPDFINYQQLVNEGLCDSVTRVYKYDKSMVSRGSSKMIDNCMVLGINTKEFGETAYLKDELNVEKHWFNYLNDLSENGNGVIISRNLADILTLEVGDKLTVHGLTLGRLDELKKLDCKIVDIVDVWPGYDRYEYTDGEVKEKYLAVINYATMVQNFELAPYEVWGRVSDGVSDEEVYTRISELVPELNRFESVDKKIVDMKNTPDIQIINGMFTLSFLISLVLCGVGFLIYWIASIQKRELLFGVYMAMGLSRKNISGMLILEHVFSTLTSVLAGGGVGMAATILFIQLFCVAYLPEKSNLDVYVYYESGDMIKLFTVIALMIIICLMVLRRMISNISITGALKKGEE